ncbi:MAG: TraB/GumN family protein [Pseudomonadota bacterium]
MRSLILGIAALFLAASSAHAACGGKNMLDELRRSNPDAVTAIEARANATQNGTGRFWKIERDGLAPSHLFGTFHTPQAAELVPEPVWAALDASEIAVFELSRSQEAEMESRLHSDPTFILSSEPTNLQDLLPPDDYTELRRAFEDRDISMQIAGALKPWLQISLLAFPPCHMAAVADGGEPLDIVMADRAFAAGIPELGLESYETALMAFDTLTQDMVTNLLVGAARTRAFEEDIFRTNMELYAAGRISLMDEFNLWMGETAMPGTDIRALNSHMMDALLRVRNNAWLKTLLPALANGNAFVAVGALHLPGPDGLIALLQQNGYSVTRLEESE